VYLDYAKRHYHCPSCEYSDAGYAVLQKSPPAFLLQPHSLYPMRQAVFDYWAGILTEHFPAHPLVARLGREFRPNTRVVLTVWRNAWRTRTRKLRRRLMDVRIAVEDRLARLQPIRSADRPASRPFPRRGPRSFDSLDIFVSYSHVVRDSSLVFSLLAHVEQRLPRWKRTVTIDGDHHTTSYASVVHCWCDRTVTSSTKWQDALDDHEFESARVILLMLSPDYLGSDYCRRQMTRADERAQAGAATMIPVRLRSIAWQPPPHWALLPADGHPVDVDADLSLASQEIAARCLQSVPLETQKDWVDELPKDRLL
jgi:hypothetical protein